MLNKYIGGIATALAILSPAAQADNKQLQPSYDYVEVGYLSADIGGASGKGYQAAASKLIHNNFFIAADYRAFDIDSADITFAGYRVGGRYEIGSGVDAVATIGGLSLKTPQTSESKAQYSVGLMARPSEQFELAINYLYATDLTGYSVGGVVHINKAWGVRVNYAAQDIKNDNGSTTETALTSLSVVYKF